MKIKEGFVEKYKKYLTVNLESFFDDTEGAKVPNTYVMAILLGTEMIGEAMDEGLTPEEAFKELTEGLKGLTGYMVGAIAETVVKFHPKGEEFRAWWNAKHGVKSDEGTVNPALVTFEPKPTKAD